MRVIVSLHPILDERFLDRQAVEVTVRPDHTVDDESTFVIGQDPKTLDCVIVEEDGPRKGQLWGAPIDGYLDDALEALLTHELCSDCDGTGQTESGWVGGSVGVLDHDCERCSNTGRAPCER